VIGACVAADPVTRKSTETAGAAKKHSPPGNLNLTKEDGPISTHSRRATPMRNASKST